ncbi:hypothetical protein LA080_000792 [Diaporthe eres]|uniref:Ankyrin repeat protein n=1 Tax=Diaporthe vaccinii TaxID=105482 RepID=A0ABR4EEV8_9PEZI|nr:hypothetical protein LA080_000792 [Diaporthe eres]
MASPSTFTPSTAPYYEFQRRGPQTLPNWTCDGEGALHDHDGTVLYETEYSSLLRAIIKRNDVVLLRKYLAIHPSWLGPAEIPLDDPFWTAAAHGSTDALDVMLQHWAANPDSILAPDERGFRLLHVACAHAQLPTVRFLIDDRRPWASRFGYANAIAVERDAHGQTAILSAASWYRHGHQVEHDDSEEVMRLLLSKGARATDAVFPPGNTEPLLPLTMVVSLPTVDQPLDTVLSLAVSGASADIIKRLVDGGADVHAKTIYVDTTGLFEGTCDVAWDVTPLHIGSMFANANGIQVLRERRGDGIEWRDMASCRDSHGRLPLHWAAGGIWAETKASPDDIVRTMELLLADNAADTVSCPDVQGDTPLHYAVRSSNAGVAAPDMGYRVAKFLCDKGARAGTRGTNGQTPLHCLVSTHAVRPSSGMMALSKLLLAHGADVGDQDADGNTVLHLAARSAQHLGTVRFFLDGTGAGNGKSDRDLLLRVVNAQGNTPLHVAAASQGHFARDQSVEERVRSQDAMMRALTPECRTHGDNDSGNTLLDQPNQEGKTPRQLCEERRNMWRRQQQDAQRASVAGVGRGRGRGRGLAAPSLPDSPW